MKKPAASLLAKILCWFFLNLLLVAAALAVFFAFQPQVNLRAIFRQEGSNRLRAAAMLITHDLAQTAQLNWPEVLARHAAIHQVDFAIVLADGTQFSSQNMDLPQRVIKRARGVFGRKPPPGRFPARRNLEDVNQRPQNRPGDDLHGRDNREPRGRRGPPRTDEGDKRPYLVMHTKNPTRYWTGVRIPLPPGPLYPPTAALLLAVSDSVTGNGFFFDPLPWLLVITAMILMSALFWIPMVRSITRPLARMTLATEEIARGGFDVSIHEPRSDEIGRLARAINHMTARLSAFVKGQKRFLGDVAHELGSPIARIQFGLGALEQRIGRDHRQRVIDVMEDVDHLSKLVNELLAFSRAEMKSPTVTLENIDLLPVVQAAVKRELPPETEVIVRIDPEIRVVASSELLTRALANLVRNAVKYAGGAGPIEITAEKRNRRVEIEVRDNGPGVPEDLLDQLFEPFFRPEASRDRDSGGVGLGLAIVKTCVETCKGNVSAANLTPKGFAVKIDLPS